MTPPVLDSDQEYFDLNKEAWEKADSKQVPTPGDQVVIELMSLSDPIIVQFESAFKTLYYRAKFVEQFEDSKYCKMETVDGDNFSPCAITQIRVVPKDLIW